MGSVYVKLDFEDGQTWKRVYAYWLVGDWYIVEHENKKYLISSTHVKAIYIDP